MKKLYFYTLLLILLILQSCTFEPKGADFVKVDPTGKPPDIQINLNLAADTLFIPIYSTVTFAYGLNNAKINWVQFIVNGGLSNQINIEPNMTSLSRTFNENAGATYSLEMKIFAKSQTGSIADVVGAEGYLISRKWTIVIVNISQLASRITKADFLDGSLKIDWEKYKGMEFKNYKIYKTMPNSQKGSFLLATINSHEQTSYIDTTYCGEESQYYILTNDTYQGTAYGLKGPIPILTAENTANGALLFKWTKPPYYRNLKGYRISYYDNIGKAQQMAEIPDATSESFNIPNPLFAHLYKLYLTPLSKTDNFYTQSNSMYYLSTSASAALGQPIPKYNYALTGQGSMIYLIDQTQQITLFDPLKFTTDKQLKYKESIYKFAVSPNDKYLVSIGLIPKKIYFEDLSDPTKSKSIDISVSIPQTVNNISISNAGIGILMTYNKGILYDYINERKLAELNLSGSSSYSNKISASGNFFYLDTYSNFVFYQYKDNQTILLESGINQGDDIVLDCYFLPGNYEKMVRVYHNRIEILDCNTWTIEKKWLFPNLISHVFNFDIKSGKLLMSVNTKMVLFDVTNGTQEELATIDDSVYNMTSFFYSNGFLFWGEGSAYKKN
jgi:hypothetical protein